MPSLNHITKNNTSVKNINGKTVVTLYSTQVVIHDPAARTVTLNSGGFRTSTTKNRMAQYFNVQGLKIAVFQKARKWFVSVNGQTLPFHDGMTVKV